MKPTFTPSQIAAAVPKVRKGLAQYEGLQATYNSPKNLRTATTFERKFNAFYRVRRNQPWRRAFFTLLRKSQARSFSFRQVLTHLQRETGRIEASFSSKLLATANPEMPVVDSVVLRNLGLKLPQPQAKDRIGQICKLHRRLGATLKKMLRRRIGRHIVRKFEMAYPKAALSKLKMLDLVIWQIR